MPKRSIKSPTERDILTSLWATENADSVGYDAKTNTFTKYRDPNGEDWLVGPGLKVGAAIGNKRSYTPAEVDAAAIKFGRNSLEAIGDAYNETYGNNTWDTVSVAPKMIMMDTRYQNGRLPKDKWPKLYQAAADGNWAELIRQSRSKFKRNGVQYYDNERVVRRANTFLPGMFNVTHKGQRSEELPVVTPASRNKKPYGGRFTLE